MSCPDFYSDIEDFAQILCRYLLKKLAFGTSGWSKIKGFSKIIFLPSNFPIDYRDEETTFTNENEAKILVPVAGPSGEVY